MLLLIVLWLLIEGLRVHFGLNHCLLHCAVCTELLRHHLSFSLRLTCIKLLILHFRRLCIVLAGLHSVVLCLLYLPEGLHLFFLSHSLLRSQMLQLIVFISLTTHWYRLLLLILDWDLSGLWFKSWIILNIDSI